MGRQIKKGEYAGDKNPRWKGKNACYASKHIYITKNHGHPQECELCGIEGRKEKDGRWSIQWALKKGKEYTHNISDYLKLCRRCHGVYDFDEKKRENLKIARNKFKKQLLDPEVRERMRIRNQKNAKDRVRDKLGHFV